MGQPSIALTDGTGGDDALPLDGDERALDRRAAGAVDQPVHDEKESVTHGDPSGVTGAPVGEPLARRMAQVLRRLWRRVRSCQAADGADAGMRRLAGVSGGGLVLGCRVRAGRTRAGREGRRQEGAGREE